MKVSRVEILKVDKDGSVFMKVFSSEGIFSFWGYIKSDGRLLNQEGEVVARIKSSYAQELIKCVLGRIRYAYTISKKELEGCL